MDNGIFLNVNDYCAFCPEFEALLSTANMPECAKECIREYRRAELMKQRWYKVVFETIERKPIRRTVTVCSTDSVHASALVYQQFGRKKIKVKSAKKVKESE